MNDNRVLRIHPEDNVLVALTDLETGEHIDFEGQRFQLTTPVYAKHKFFTSDLHQGDTVIMYGVMVGRTTASIKSGTAMTTANVKHAAEPYHFRHRPYTWDPPRSDAFKQLHFDGYHRTDGNVGTANYWLFIPTVFCENRNLDVIKEALHNTLGYSVSSKYKSFTESLLNAYVAGVSLSTFNPIGLQPDPKRDRVFKNIDGIKFLNHQGGCGGTRQDAQTLSKLLAAYVNHPNVAGVTVLSLGCQHLQVNDLLQAIKVRPSNDKPVLVFEQQLMQSEEQLITHAIHQTFLGIEQANKIERKPAPLSKLCVGVKCGGSDGFSGISANPAVGHTADLLVALGAKVLLAEFPELCGVEQNLIDRAADQTTAEKFIRLMDSYSAEAEAAGSGFHMNPSPGNIKDGLITDAIKSAGAARKAGTSPVVDVLDYTEPATKAGLSLVCTPGNDVEATTGKAAAGATLILFTTGLGTPTGNPVCPTIKVATNTALAQRMKDIIDIDCGPIIRGEKTIQQMGDEILYYCIEVASGRLVPKAVQLNQDDFIPWKRGVSL